MMLRAAPRALPRSVPRATLRSARRYAHHTHAEQIVAEGNPSKEWLAKKADVEHHAGETTDLWRKISFYVAVPGTLIAFLWVQRVEKEHAEHEEHLKEEHGGELPPVPEYPYLNIRKKAFPWGVNSLFFNPHTNKNMEGAAEE